MRIKGPPAPLAAQRARDVHWRTVRAKASALLRRRRCSELIRRPALFLDPERPSARWVAGEQLRLLGGQGGGAHDRDASIAEHQANAASRQGEHPRALAGGLKGGQLHLQAPQGAIDPQRPARLACEDVKVLVARERARLVVEPLHQAVQEVPHFGRIPRSPPASPTFGGTSASKLAEPPPADGPTPGRSRLDLERGGPQGERVSVLAMVSAATSTR